MDGLAVGASCYRAAAEAAAAACSSVAGITAQGVASCEAPSLSSGGLLSYTLAVESSTARTTRPAQMQLQPCTPNDLTEWGPVLAAWMLAMVLILVTRNFFKGVFGGSLPT